jgi:hypothetical protein
MIVAGFLGMSSKSSSHARADVPAKAADGHVLGRPMACLDRVWPRGMPHPGQGLGGAVRGAVHRGIVRRRQRLQVSQSLGTVSAQMPIFERMPWLWPVDGVRSGRDPRDQADRGDGEDRAAHAGLYIAACSFI